MWGICVSLCRIRCFEDWISGYVGIFKWKFCFGIGRIRSVVKCGWVYFEDWYVYCFRRGIDGFDKKVRDFV